MLNIQKIKVVCFGGGTGLPVLLSGLKHNTKLDLAAIVTMFDAGGSSGVLKDQFGILPPGDILKCLLALSQDEQATRKLLLTRIESSATPHHSAGNILLLGLEKVYGNFTEAVHMLGQILSIRGLVCPVALDHATLCAHYEDGIMMRGEVNIDKGIGNGKKLSKLFLDPPVKSNIQALDIVKKADIFCIGPGSFYTSVLPNFLPRGMQNALMQSEAPIIFTTNLVTEGLGMREYSVNTMVSILEQYLGRKVAKVIVNKHIPKERLSAYAKQGKFPITLNNKKNDKKYIQAKLWDDISLARHSKDKLATLVSDTIDTLT